MYDYDAVENLNCNDDIANIVHFGENKKIQNVQQNPHQLKNQEKLNVLAKSKTVCQKCFQEKPTLNPLVALI